MRRPLRFQQSRWPVLLRALFVLCALGGAWALGTAPAVLLLAWLPLFYLLALPGPNWQASLDQQGRLWLYQPGKPVLQGQLLASSQVSWFGCWLYWQDPQGGQGRRWVFADALPAEDYRLLARIIRQLRWQQKAV